MSVDIKLKHSSVADRVPTSGDLANGELALNLADEKIYMKNADGDVVQVAGKGGGDGEYVQVAGDNMTGDLTLGTDKITLDAGDGSAEFKGDVQGGSARFAGSGGFGGIDHMLITLSVENRHGQAATIYGRNHGFDGAPVIYVTDSSGDEKARVNNDGSAAFQSTVTAPNITFNLEPDDDANYTTTTEEYTEQTVTRTREIKTYTGPTMDVKEQLLAYEARFKQQDAVIAQMTEALKKLGADIDPPAAATKKSTKKK